MRRLTWRWLTPPGHNDARLHGPEVDVPPQVKVGPRPVLLLRRAPVSLQTRAPSLSQEGGPRPRSAARNVEAQSMVDEALDFYVRATGKDGAQKRQELVNMRPGDLRRYLERWQARAEEVQRLQEKKGQSWKFFRRQGVPGRRTREEFEECAHKVMRNIEADEKLLQNGRTSCRPRPGAESRSEDRETKQREMEDSSSQRRRAWEKLREPGLFSSSPYQRTGQLKYDVGLEKDFLQLIYLCQNSRLEIATAVVETCSTVSCAHSLL